VTARLDEAFVEVSECVCEREKAGEAVYMCPHTNSQRECVRSTLSSPAKANTVRPDQDRVEEGRAVHHLPSHT
jgi:hypothetical protein